MLSILSNSFRTATRMEQQPNSQKPAFRNARNIRDDRQLRVKQEPRRWHKRWYMG